MTKLEALVGLNMFCGIGTIRLNKLLEFFGKPENILKARCQELTQVFGIGENIAQKITSLKKEDIDKEFSLAQKLGLKILTQEDADYPQNLKHIPDPPFVLYVKGRLEEKDRCSIAVVGSRRASFYGLTSAEKFSADLANEGFTIISGLARGIDTCAHKGALKSGGRTIAVMGSGFQYIYPAENKKLVETIAQNGAVISEFPINTRPLSQNFPCRNRVISGLSLGVLVVEAARNSGALITADFALEQGRDVFALPGKVDSDNSFGTNELIKQGAKLVSCAEDISEEFNFGQDMELKKSKSQEAVVVQPVKSLSLAEDESLLYNLLSEQPASLDEIVEKSNIDIPKISGLLLKLSMRRLIKELPGKQFVKTAT